MVAENEQLKMMAFLYIDMAIKKGQASEEQTAIFARKHFWSQKKEKFSHLH